jgi:hypothetical protein
MRSIPRFRSSAPALLAAAALTLAPLACDDGEITLPDEGTARVSVLLTDAPGDVEALWVEITEIYLQGDEGRVTLLDLPTDLVEITSLVGTTQELVDEAVIPAGTYGQLRLVVGDAVLETDDGEVYVKGEGVHPDGLEATGELVCPSCSQSGLKVILGGAEIDFEEGASNLVLDFDVARSIGRPAGNSGRWIMRPVIHSTLLDDDDDDGAEIEGTVELAAGVTIPECPAGTPRSLEDFVPTATAGTLVDDDGNPVLRTGEVDDDGSFEIDYLPPETWTLGWLNPVALDGANLVFQGTVEPVTVVVTQESDDDVEDVRYVITGSVCNPVGG